MTKRSQSFSSLKRRMSSRMASTDASREPVTLVLVPSMRLT